ncbi:MAG: hypothetical protein WC661_19210 [Opitutaceae bacterium]|jgi:hypothetical protein
MRISRPATSPRSGFALLITITVLAFLVLLLVSLASLTRVETQVAGNNQKLSEARQNAMMALNLAIGQLQTYAGPDQRISAPANAGTTATNPQRSDDNPHWVGIWRNTTPASDTATPALLTWLVSGNEDPSDPKAWYPDRPVDDPTGDANSDTVWLVGDQTVIEEPSPSVRKRVKLPKQDITVDGLVPGLGGTQTIGRYAWWVGDEGVKARVNLFDPHANSSDLAERGFSFISSQRTAIELIDRNGSSTSLGDLYPDPSSSDFASVEKVSGLQQLSLLSTSSPDVIRDTAKARFHDLTAHSYSVLADAAQGGLKKDLSAGLAAGASEPANTDTIFTPVSGATYGVPTWEMLRSFASTQVSHSAGAPLSPLQNPDLGTGSTVTGPVMTFASLGLNYGTDPSAPDKVNLHLFPCVVLWNPYTVALPANDYTVGFGTSGADIVQFKLRRYVQYTSTANPTDHRWLRADDTTAIIANANERNRMVATFRLMKGGGFSTAGSDAYLRFKVSTGPIPPGQSLVFMLPDNTAAGTAYDPLTTTLVNGITPGESVVMPALNASSDSDKQVTVSTPQATFGTYTSGSQTYTRDPAAPDRFELYQDHFYGGEAMAVLTETDTRAQALTNNWQPPAAGASPRWYHGVLRAAITGLNHNNGALRTYNDSVYGGNLPSAQDIKNGVDTNPVVLWTDIGMTMANTPGFLPWIAHANPRAVAQTRVQLDAQPGGSSANPANGFKKWQYSASRSWPKFNYDPDIPRASAGSGLDNNGTPTDLTLFEFPTPELGLLSLGQLQHANLGTVSAYPAYAIGNSLADFRIQRTSTFAGNPAQVPPAFSPSHYDLSWHLNRALWDRYFFSTVPSGQAPTSTRQGGAARPAWTQANLAAGEPLPNARLRLYDEPAIGALVPASGSSAPYHQAAAHLLVAGGFNVNSTSEQAWRAVLAGSFGVSYRPDSPETAAVAGLKAAFPRFAVPTADDSTSSLDGMWQGYRQLDETQIATLARNIVTEVKTRGPFLSLADFVNRRLANDATGLKGPLQAAIDATTSGTGAANPATMQPFDGQRVDSISSTYTTYIPQHAANDDNMSSAAAHRSRHAFGPKFLTQADVLTALGPVLAVRSDTFLVRAYGEALNPVLAPGAPDYVKGRAWLEAIVQRVPDYVDSTNPWDTPAAGSPSATYGRRFKVISFRWLSPADL